MLSPSVAPFTREGDHAPASDPYRQVFEAAGVGIARLAPSGRLLEANQRFAEIVGRPQSALAGLDVMDLTHPEDHAVTAAEIESTLYGMRPRYTLEKRYLRPDGTVVWVHVSTVLVRDAQGEPTEFVSVIEDITERRRLQEAMNSARAAERASQAKTEFLSRMSHELRTPLNAMLGFAQLLRVDPRHPLNETQQRSVQHIERAGAHLLAMLTDVLDLSRIEAGSMPMQVGAVALQQTLDEAVAMVSNQAAASGLTLTVTPSPVPLHVQADHVRLRQILVNLLSNAIKYNRPGGRVLLETMAVGNEVVITVMDTGRGLHPDQLAHLFEPFNRLGAERTGVEGTGIGLVIVRRLLELMQGRIEVSSRPGEGSIFRVWLPAAAAPDADGEVGGRSGFGTLDGHDDLGCGPLTVLYAEDNVVNVELVRQVLRMRPHWHLEVARCGREAIEMAQSHPPQLVLLDMHLGDMSGLDVADALAANPALACVPCVALSADAMPDQISEARRRGFVDYLTKPLDVGRLLRLLDQLAVGQHLP
ncbi:MAG: ATP-binding protein [Aquabacterium sp.]